MVTNRGVLATLIGRIREAVGNSTLTDREERPFFVSHVRRRLIFSEVTTGLPIVRSEVVISGEKGRYVISLRQESTKE